MASMRDRLNELENRVEVLELELLILRNEIKRGDKKESPNEIERSESDGAEIEFQSGSVPLASLSREDLDRLGIDVGAKSLEDEIKPSKKTPRPSIFDKFKDKESLVGKYLIGALASILIFIAAASFIAIIWNKISSEFKLATVSLIGLALTGYGFRMTLKKPGNVGSIVFGTGIGLVYISILSANLVFSLISYAASALLCVLWTVLILFSHRYTKLYFTIIVAGIGSFINLYFELRYVTSYMDIYLIIVYTGVVSAMIIYMSRTLDKIRYLIGIFYSYLSFTFIFIATCWLLNFSYAYAQTAVVLIMILITNYLYYLSNREDIFYSYFPPTVISALALWVSVVYSLRDVLGLSLLQSLFVVLVVVLTQFILNHILYPIIEEWLSLFFMLSLYIIVISITEEIFGNIWMGAAFIMLLCLLRKKIWNKSILVPFMMLFIVLDFSLTFEESSIWTMVFSILNLILLFYILYEERVKELLYKNFAVVSLIFGCFKLSYDLCEITKLSYNYFYIETVLAQLISVITVLIIYKIGYLKGENGEKYRIAENAMLYVISLFLYVMGMHAMFTTHLVYLRFIAMLSTLIIAVFQSRILLSDYKEIPDIFGVWLVAKYFIFTFGVMRAFWELPVDSILYSVAGLILAVAAIYAGFRLGIKIIRKTGLIIAMLMVAKFIFADLQGENTMIRVLSFAAGGVLCFIISVIYNRLSKE